MFGWCVWLLVAGILPFKTMKSIHSFRQVAGDSIWKYTYGLIDDVINRLLFCLTGATEYMTGDQVLITRVTNTDPQAMEIFLVAHTSDDVAKTVLSTVAASGFELGDARGHVQFVMDDQNFAGFDFVEVR